MYYPNKQDFIKLSKEGNLIPIFREIIADMETPVSAYKKIEGEYSFLLESVEGGEKIARYSFLGSDPILIFKSKGNKAEIIEGGKRRIEEGDPLSILSELLKRYKPVKIGGLPRFHGGFVGYIGYDVVRFIEKIPDKNPDDLKLPDLQFLLTDTILAFDHIKHKILVISNAYIKGDPGQAYKAAIEKIEAIVSKLEKAVKKKEMEFEIPSEGEKKLKVKSNFEKIEFEKIVEAAKEYVRAGDIIQVVLSQRFEAETSAPPFNIYRVLRTINPSPYMYYLKFGKEILIGSSPEVMVRLEEGVITLRPIAGTRRRGETEEEDKFLEKELLSDKKELAEHIMLVDLGRNDLGRVCEYGSVKVTELMVIEKYSHVMHIVTNVTGNIKKEKDAFHLLRATLPAGTVTGAPKVRAMEIIDELENLKRGPYAGAVGYFSFSGDLDTCITIRTIIIKGNKAYVQAGAGIVADSIPEKEYEETVSKAKALLRAIELAQ